MELVDGVLLCVLNLTFVFSNALVHFLLRMHGGFHKST